MAVTLDEKRAELAQAKEDLAAASRFVSMGQGDKSLQRASLPSLENRVARLAREVRDLEAAAYGTRSSGTAVASWNS